MFPCWAFHYESWVMVTLIVTLTPVDETLWCGCHSNETKAGRWHNTIDFWGSGQKTIILKITFLFNCVVSENIHPPRGATEIPRGRGGGGGVQKEAIFKAEQGGFKKMHGTVDSIFTLKMFIDKRSTVYTDRNYSTNWEKKVSKDVS